MKIEAEEIYEPVSGPEMKTEAQISQNDHMDDNMDKV